MAMHILQQQAHHLLTLLSIGLLELEESDTHDLVIPLHPTIRQGWEELCFLCFQLGELPPRTLPELAAWLHRSPNEWTAIGQFFTGDEYKTPLLHGGSVSQLCIQLGDPYVGVFNVHLELEDALFKRIYDRCRQLGNAELYAQARLFLCRHPVIADHFSVLMSETEDWPANIRRLVEDCYEDIPPEAIFHHGKDVDVVLLCPYCGWTLRRRKREWVCHEGGFCLATHGDLAETAEQVPYRVGMSRLKEGVQRYVAAPERTLIKLADALNTMGGVHVTFYPELDSYDLLVEFMNGERWAVDMKEHRRAGRLAFHLKGFPFSPRWTRAFYLFPDHLADSEGYLNEFANYWTPQNDVSFMGVRAFLKNARKESEK
ncbi:MAG: hypothetical protein IT324_33350 [Anaerolineae bacterium]|nr:hypothetical protein [Anaerolineae bacterium]